MSDVIEVVKETLAVQNISEDVIKKTLAEIQKAAQAVKEEEKSESEPKTRKEFGLLSFETEDPAVLKGYVFQLDSNVEAHTISTKVSEAAREYNGTKKGKKKPVSTLSEAVEVIASKFFKNVGLNRKTKSPVFFGKYENKL